jgi:hypothetical protein
MAGRWLAGGKGGRWLAQRGGQPGQGACAASALALAFELGHGGQADVGFAGEFGWG